MTAVVSWNIQAGLGCDGRVDLKRISDTIIALTEPDIICLQEVECSTGDDSAKDQFAAFRNLFSGYTGIEGSGVERASDEGSYRFGNMVLTRLPVLSVFRHPLPWPVATGVKHMPRQATEVTVATPAGPLRIVTTHLEFHAQAHRQAQVARLRELHSEAAAQVLRPGEIQPTGPYARIERPATSIICGDFNMELGSEEYTAMLAPFDDGTPDLADAWSALYPDRPHDPTCGIFDRQQWPAGAHCRDFFFVTEDLHRRLLSLEVNTQTDASDHQPMALLIDDPTPGAGSA